LFQPRISGGNSNSTSSNASATFNDDPYQNGITDPLSQIADINKRIKINENASKNWTEGENYNLSGSLMLNRRLGGGPWFGPSAVTGSSGRNITLRLNGTISENESKNFNWSNVIYHQRNDSTDLTYRHRNNPSSNKNYSISLSYSEPILRNLFAQINYSYNYSKRHSDGHTYDFAKVDSIGQELWDNYGQYGMLAPNYFEFLSDSLSRYTDNINKTHNIDATMRYTTEFLNLSAGFRLEQQNQKMIYQYQGLDTIASRDISRISPTLNARFRFTRQHTLRLTYRGNSSQPEMTDLFNLTDNSNPLNIREGNPNLKPSFTHNIGLDYNNYFELTRQSLVGRLSYNTTQNSIANRTEYNAETGGQRTRPENINGNWSVSGNFGFRTPIFIDKLTISTNTSTSFNNNVSYLYQNQETMKNKVKNLRIGERLTLTWREEYFDVVLNGSLNYNNSRSKLIKTNNRDTYDFSYGISSNANLENGFGFSTSLNMNSRRGYSSANMNTNELIWNAQVSYRFLQGRRATISLHAYDILHNRSNISRSISATMRSDSRTNAINSYMMLNFTYRFGKFGGRNGGGRGRMEGGESYREENRNNAPANRGGGNEGGRPTRGNGGPAGGGPGGGRGM
jgi:hypothetical protein